MQVESCPDPLISANIYCAGQIDSLIGGAIAPFWRDLSSHSDAASFYLWLLRYDKGGEHLKIRLHGRGEIQAHVAELLQDSVASFFADQPPTEQAGHTGSAKESPLTSRLPPIDVEDEAGASVPNRTLVFTQYRRSPISLGPKPYLDNGLYLAALTRCLARGCEEILLATKDDGGRSLSSQRQSLLLKLLIVGLSALDSKQTAYLRYHRDWLLRFPLLKSNTADEHGRELLRRFERFCTERVEQLKLLERSSHQAWRENAPTVDTFGTHCSFFRDAIFTLLSSLRSSGKSKLARVDPFAPDRRFPLLFKAMHGLANQLGLSGFEEAFSLHLLLRASEPESSGDLSFSLLPFSWEFE